MSKQYSLQGTNDNCRVCEKPQTKDGHDPCLGTLPESIVMNACCGHEEPDKAYVQLWTGDCVRGERARKYQEILKRTNK